MITMLFYIAINLCEKAERKGKGKIEKEIEDFLYNLSISQVKKHDKRK